MAAVETAIVCCAPLAAPRLDVAEAEATAELFKALAEGRPLKQWTRPGNMRVTSGVAEDN